LAGRAGRIFWLTGTAWELGRNEILNPDIKSNVLARVRPENPEDQDELRSCLYPDYPEQAEARQQVFFAFNCSR
jgi:hypothetical protein